MPPVRRIAHGWGVRREENKGALLGPGFSARSWGLVWWELRLRLGGWKDSLRCWTESRAKRAAGGINLKRVKYLSVALGGVLFLGMSVGAVAQSGSATMEGMGPPQGAPQHAPAQMTMDERMARLTQVLNLTPAQQQKIRPVLEQAQQQMQALAADNATPMADRQVKAQAIRENVRSQIDAVLTPEQKQHAEAMSQQRPGGPGTPPAQPQSQPQK
jgi:Spy/CpxP family protein refolding chaperone